MVELFVHNKTQPKLKLVKYDHNHLGLFIFQSGYRKFYLNSTKGYSRKIINAQTDYTAKSEIFVVIYFLVDHPHSVIIFGLLFAFFTHIYGKKRTVSKYVR